MEQKVRLKKWVKYPLLMIITVGVGYFVYLIAMSIIFKPRDVRITNLTSASVTISWITDSPRVGKVEYKVASKGFVPIFTGLGADKAFDERDWHNAQADCVSEFNQQASESKDENFSVNGDNYACSEFQVEKKGKYYVHHVVLRGLDSETKYHFRVGDNLFKWKAKDGDAFETYTPVSSVSEPIPIFGRVVSESGEYSNDSLVYIQFGKSGEKMTESILYSVVTNEDGGWYMDGGNIRGVDGEVYQLVSVEDEFIIHGLYKNNERSRKKNYLFGYFDGAYPDIKTSTLLNSESSLLIQQAYAVGDGCEWETIADCTIEQLNNHPEFGVGNQIKYSSIQSAKAENPAWKEGDPVAITREVVAQTNYGNDDDDWRALLSVMSGTSITEETYNSEIENGEYALNLATTETGYAYIDHGEDGIESGVTIIKDCDLGDTSCEGCIPGDSDCPSEIKGTEGKITISFDESAQATWTFAGEKLENVNDEWILDENIQKQIQEAQSNCLRLRGVNCDSLVIEPINISFVDVLNNNDSLVKCLNDINECSDTTDGNSIGHDQMLATLRVQRNLLNNNIQEQGRIDNLLKEVDTLNVQQQYSIEYEFAVGDDGEIDADNIMLGSEYLTTSMLTNYWDSYEGSVYKKREFIDDFLASLPEDQREDIKDNIQYVVGFLVTDDGSIMINYQNGNSEVVISPLTDADVTVPIPIEFLPDNSNYEITTQMVSNTSMEIVSIDSEFVEISDLTEIWNTSTTREDKIIILSNFVDPDKLDSITDEDWDTYIANTGIYQGTFDNSHHDVFNFENTSLESITIPAESLTDESVSLVHPVKLESTSNGLPIVSQEVQQENKEVMVRLSNDDPLFDAFNNEITDAVQVRTVECLNLAYGCSQEVMESVMFSIDPEDYNKDKYTFVLLDNGRYAIASVPPGNGTAIEKMSEDEAMN